MFTTDSFLELQKFINLPAAALALAAGLVIRVAQSTATRPSAVTTERGPGYGTPMHFLAAK
jgi:hypothetical protein